MRNSEKSAQSQIREHLGQTLNSKEGPCRMAFLLFPNQAWALYGTVRKSWWVQNFLRLWPNYFSYTTLLCFKIREPWLPHWFSLFIESKAIESALSRWGADLKPSGKTNHFLPVCWWVDGVTWDDSGPQLQRKFSTIICGCQFSVTRWEYVKIRSCFYGKWVLFFKK